uniref:Uncharacterized protein n=1 Tax=Avena sativa TaxID=4498 RepID=A0ACD5XNL8_AVESA
MSMQRDRRRRQTQARDVSVPLLAKRGCSSRQKHDDSEGKRLKYSGPDLPEEIWCHIHSLVPMQDAARASCVSRTFRRCWRYYPNITFRNTIVGLNRDVRGKEETASEYASKVNQVLTNHSGIGLKTIKLEFFGHRSCDCCFIDSWLQVAITPAIEELSLVLSSNETTYSFPCPLLTDQCGHSIRYLHLGGCVFRPAVRLGCFSSLVNLLLYNVRINEDELRVLLSSCSALEQFGFGHNNEITCLKIPCMLQRLRDLRVVACNKLRAIEIKAPNVSSLSFGKRVQLSLGESLQLKKLAMSYLCALHDAHGTLLSTMPNLETLYITSHLENNIPIMQSQFLCLKYLTVTVYGYTYPNINDYISLIPFLDASPSLETFVLNALEPMEHKSIFRDRSHLRRMPGHRHDKLKSVTIIGFNSAKSLIELTVHIIENAVSLESLTLDTVGCALRCSDSYIDKCIAMRESTRKEVPSALLAVQKYIQCKIPSTVKLDVLEPCGRCHASSMSLRCVSD